MTKSNLNGDIRKFLKKLEPFEPSQYEKTTLTILAVAAIYKMEQNGIELLYHNIAVTLHKLFPKKFSMTYFTEHPDLNKIDDTVRKGGGDSGWIQGTRKQGYFKLSQTGRIEAEEALALLDSGKAVGTSGRSMSSSGSDRIIILLNEVSHSKAYKKFSEKRINEITNFEIRDVLHGTSNTSMNTLTKNLKTINDAAKALSDHEQHKDWTKQIFEFLKFLQKKLEEI